MGGGMIDCVIFVFIVIALFKGSEQQHHS